MSTSVQRRERAKLERRATIIAAATRVFSERGLVAATMDEVAREAGVSKGALYLYFESKDDLYLEIAGLALDGLVSRFELIAENSEENGLCLLKLLVKSYMEYALSDMGRFSAAIGWITSNYTVGEGSERFLDYQRKIARLHEMCSQAVATGQSDGSITLSGEPRLIALQIWGTALGLLLIEHRADALERRIPDLPNLAGMGAQFLDHVLSDRQCSFSDR